MLCDLVDRNRHFVFSCSPCVQNKEDAVYTASYRGIPWSGLVLRMVMCGIDTVIVHAVGYIINRDRQVLSPELLTDDGISVTVNIIVVRGWFSRAFRGTGLATHLLMMWKFGRVLYCWLTFEVWSPMDECQVRWMRRHCASKHGYIHCLFYARESVGWNYCRNSFITLWKGLNTLCCYKRVL